jgi:hypothetical protein
MLTVQREEELGLDVREAIEAIFGDEAREHVLCNAYRGSRAIKNQNVKNLILVFL